MARQVRKKPRYQVEAEAKAAEKAAKVEELSRTLGTRLPDGRIAADPTQQILNNSYGPPLLYYEDQEFQCRDCGKAQVWTAEQQKWWYEVAKGSILSQAVRCRDCRVALRTAHGGTPRRSRVKSMQPDEA
jgi:hypothetical protein